MSHGRNIKYKHAKFATLELSGKGLSGNRTTHPLRSKFLRVHLTKPADPRKYQGSFYELRRCWRATSAERPNLSGASTKITKLFKLITVHEEPMFATQSSLTSLDEVIGIFMCELLRYGFIKVCAYTECC